MYLQSFEDQQLPQQPQFSFIFSSPKANPNNIIKSPKQQQNQLSQLQLNSSSEQNHQYFTYIFETVISAMQIRNPQFLALYTEQEKQISHYMGGVASKDRMLTFLNKLVQLMCIMNTSSVSASQQQSQELQNMTPQQILAQNQPEAFHKFLQQLYQALNFKSDVMFYIDIIQDRFSFQQQQQQQVEFLIQQNQREVEQDEGVEQKQEEIVDFEESIGSKGAVEFNPFSLFQFHTSSKSSITNNSSNNHNSINKNHLSHNSVNNNAIQINKINNIAVQTQTQQIQQINQSSYESPKATTSLKKLYKYLNYTTQLEEALRNDNAQIEQLDKFFHKFAHNTMILNNKSNNNNISSKNTNIYQINSNNYFKKQDIKVSIKQNTQNDEIQGESNDTNKVFHINKEKNEIFIEYKNNNESGHGFDEDDDFDYCYQWKTEKNEQ